MDKTSEQFDLVVNKSKEIFTKKLQDYGTAWRILQTSSITDQIFIKAQRIRSIEQKGIKKVDEGIKPEFMGIVNYAVIALIQLELGELKLTENPPGQLNLPSEEAIALYDKFIIHTKNLMDAKNHDYDDAWRDMRISSINDLILVKVMRIKQIEDNKGKTLISEGIDANYYDIINYAIFALIKLEEENITS
ncbi:MAG: DUF1599 domain-containing protein [Bacteroidota bacterium]